MVILGLIDGCNVKHSLRRALSKSLADVDASSRIGAPCLIAGHSDSARLSGRCISGGAAAYCGLRGGLDWNRK